MPEANVGHELKVARTILKLGQKEVAEAVGITVPYLSAVENGVYIPSERLLRDLKEAVGWTSSIASLVKSQKAAAPGKEV